MNKKTMLLLLALLAFPTAITWTQGLPGSGQKTITLSDKVGKNQFEWWSDAPLEKIKGTAEGVTGKLTLDPQNPSSLRGTISATVATMKTGNSTRDGHLQGESWLNAAKFPRITFTATSTSNIKVSGNKMTADVTGKFSMHGVEKTLTLPIELTYVVESAKTRERAPGDLVLVTATFTISLKDFNVAGTRGTVGSKVGETIKITAKLFGSTGL